MTKRNQIIGAAARSGARPMSMCVNEDHRWQMIGLAAVSRAREIDTCDSCIHYSFGDESDGYYKWCNLHKETTGMIDGCGCNRHQPKEEL